MAFIAYVLGLIGFCIVFGIIIGQMGHEAQVMIDFFDVLSHVVMRIVNFIMWSVLDALLQLLCTVLVDCIVQLWCIV